MTVWDSNRSRLTLEGTKNKYDDFCWMLRCLKINGIISDSELPRMEKRMIRKWQREENIKTKHTVRRKTI